MASFAAGLPGLMRQRAGTSDCRRSPLLFPELEILRSTAVSWIRRRVTAVVTFEDGSPSVSPHWGQVAELEHRASVRTGVLRLVLALLRVSDFKLALSRIVSTDAQQQLLGAVERAGSVIPLAAAPHVLGLATARYREWIGRQHSCTLDDHFSCQRSGPQRLTCNEVEAVGENVQSKDHRCLSVRTLALHACHAAKADRILRQRMQPPVGI